MINNITPAIIVLTARGALEDRIEGLGMGADDYLPKPFSLLELQARMQAIVRRKFQVKSHVLEFRGIELDSMARRVTYQGTEISLTKKEFEILLYLIANKNRVVPKNTLAEYIWGDNASEIDNYEALFTHIKNLRRKLKTAKAEVDFRSIYGVGYQIIES